MITLIQQLATPTELANKSYEAIAAKLRAYTITEPIKTSYRLKQLEEKLGPQLALKLNNALFREQATASPFASMYASAHIAISGEIGAELWQEHRQAMIEGLSAYLSPEERAQVKALGLRSVKPYPNATAAEVQQAIIEEATRSSAVSLKQKADAALNKLFTAEHAQGLADLQALATEAAAVSFN